MGNLSFSLLFSVNWSLRTEKNFEACTISVFNLWGRHGTVFSTIDITVIINVYRNDMMLQFGTWLGIY